ncbi:alpha/beta-hydrolase [Penicillium cosmopolitanum]|uniref:Alpha/beta-hydrolase n=1 Tax=Penicillium cosmopolitanum TaxID=1131564 RepID=A0A9W9VGD3_9EURO|nr:alpha/beta-hydrolase [Penicillium cosmopolitanum]KAJ5378520.1 alpha/beta-hydrolase [Penicillium cosmopolitanum]
MFRPTTVLFIPGAWHSPDCFDAVIKQLEAVNYRTRKVYLPSVNPPNYEINYFEADVMQIRAQIEAEIANGSHVLVVVHSYGSLPANEAIRGLDLETRRKEGLDGGVSHLFFCCSFVIAEGHSLISAFGGKDLPWFMVSDDRLEVHPAGPEKIFYNDCNESQVTEAVAALRPHSYQTFHRPCTYAAWKTVPSTYLYCTQDEAIPIGVQRLLVEGTAQGYAIRTESLEASHSPFYSQPDGMTAAIQRAAGDNV